MFKAAVDAYFEGFYTAPGGAAIEFARSARGSETITLLARDREATAAARFSASAQRISLIFLFAQLHCLR